MVREGRKGKESEVRVISSSLKVRRLGLTDEEGPPQRKKHGCFMIEKGHEVQRSRWKYLYDRRGHASKEGKNSKTICRGKKERIYGAVYFSLNSYFPENKLWVTDTV